jgi:hypothetical protein
MRRMVDSDHSPLDPHGADVQWLFRLYPAEAMTATAVGLVAETAPPHEGAEVAADCRKPFIRRSPAKRML